MEFAYDQSGDEGMLTLNGKLTIDHAAELRGNLIKTMEKANHLTIRIENVTEVDLSCLQLLCSAHRTAVSLKKNLTLNIPGRGIFPDTVKTAGYSRSCGCALSPDKSCLWVGL
jgi:ABC-type transporter Mla MlaB component